MPGTWQKLTRHLFSFERSQGCGKEKRNNSANKSSLEGPWASNVSGSLREGPSLSLLWSLTPGTVPHLKQFFYLRENEREREREWGGAAEGEGEADSPLSVEPSTGFSPRTLRSRPEPKADT